MQVPGNINRPPYADTKENPPWDDNYQVHGKQVRPPRHTPDGDDAP